MFNSTGKGGGQQLTGLAADQSQFSAAQQASGGGPLATPSDGGVPVEPVSPWLPLPRCAARGLQCRDRRCRQGLAREIRSLEGGFEGVGEGQISQFPSFPLPARPHRLAVSTQNQNNDQQQLQSSRSRPFRGQWSGEHLRVLSELPACKTRTLRLH